MKDKILATNLDTTTKTSKRTAEVEAPTSEAVASVINERYDTYRKARVTKEEVWKECWAAYLGSPDAVEHIRSNVATIVGDVNDDWRHRINVGKAYEVVETINAYLQSAYFPNRDWFDMVPREPGLTEVTKVVKKYMQAKLKQANFMSHWEMYTRQLLITGFSAIALPWEKKVTKTKKRVPVQKTETDGLGGEFEVTSYEPKEVEHLDYHNTRFEVLDSFDVYLDPQATDANKANFVRTLRKSKGEVLRLIENGTYPHLSSMDVVKGGGIDPRNTENKRVVAKFSGIEYYPNELVEVVEYWGDLEVSGHEYLNIVATLVCGKLARFESNTYWAGKPFVFGTAIPLPRKVYGLGVLEPVLGMLHQLNIVTNQRLDNLELAVDTMWEYVNDGVIDPDNLATAPGKVIEVGAPGNLRPLQRDTTFTITYQEAAVLEQNIDKACGVGAYIGTQQGRSGERVTAQEIQAVRDAGGNRLSSIHRHTEQTQLMLVLKKKYKSCQQFVDTDDVVRIAGSKPRTYEYVAVGAAELLYDFDVEAIGAGHVADKERDLERIINFVQAVTQIDEMRQKIDWEAMLRQFIRKFGFDEEIEQLIIKQVEEAEGEALPQDPMQAALQQAAAMGGQPAQQVVEGQMAIQDPMAAAIGQQAGLAGFDPAAIAQTQAAMMPPVPPQ